VKSPGWFVGLVAAASLVVSHAALAQSATHDVKIEVDPSNRIEFSGARSLQVNSSATARWAVTTNESGTKVSASLNASLPAGVVLSARLTPPTGARSSGDRKLSVVAVDLVTGISRLYSGSLPAVVRLDAPMQAKVTPTSRTLTLTITNGA
jgi:hypothetical protein